MKKQIEAYVCDRCGKATLSKDHLYKCICCGKDICSSVDCSYHVTVTVNHNIPNGIPYLWTQARYRICQNCHILDGPICKELHELIFPKKNAKFYRHGSSRYNDWVRING